MLELLFDNGNLRVKDCDGNNKYDDLGINYYDQTASGFRIMIGDCNDGNSVKTDVDLEFIVYAI